MKAVSLLLLVAGLATMADIAAGPAAAATPAAGDLVQEVRSAESAFAATMAARDLEAFGSKVAADAVFFSRQGVLRGRDAVIEGWRPFFQGSAAPFSWEPEEVEVLDSGTLALSSGPVRDPSGRRIGTFNSVWRREADGGWRVVFDKGCPPCDCAPAP
jgi:ketosteroid isomerase-like protein